MWLLELIPDLLADAGDVSPEAWREVGRVVGKLNAFSECPIEYFVPTGGAVEELRDRVRGRRFERSYLELLGCVESLAAGGEAGLVHGELHSGNIGRRADGTVVLLDWDQSGTGPTFLDYGYPLVTNFVSMAPLCFERERAAEFYSGYVGAGGSVDRTKAFLSGLFHVMRYMFPPVDAYPPDEYDAEVERRWGRVCYAVEHEQELCATVS